MPAWTVGSRGRRITGSADREGGPTSLTPQRERQRDTEPHSHKHTKRQIQTDRQTRVHTQGTLQMTTNHHLTSLGSFFLWVSPGSQASKTPPQPGSVPPWVTSAPKLALLVCVFAVPFCAEELAQDRTICLVYSRGRRSCLGAANICRNKGGRERGGGERRRLPGDKATGLCHSCQR